MSKTVQWKRGNTSVNSTYVGAQGEITVNTDTWNLHVHDGLTPGGYVIDSSNGGGSFSNLTVTGNITSGNINVANTILTNTIVASGNVTAPYFIGNGSLLTGLTFYSNANVVSYAQTGWNGNIIPGANSVYSLGNVTNQWASLWVAQNTIYIGNIAVGISAGNVLTVNNEPLLSNNSNTTINTAGNITSGNLNAYRLTGTFANLSEITATGNVSADYFLGNGAFLTGIIDSVGATGATGFNGATGATGIGTNYSNANVIAYSESGWAGNIIPSANAVYTLGNVTNQWANLWVANNTIYIGNVAIGVSEANVLTVNGQPTLSNNSDVSINTDGNITAGNLNAYRITTTYANVSVLKEVELIEFTNNNFIDATTSNANLANINLSGNLTTLGVINVGNMSIGTVPGDITANANTGITLNVSGSDGGFAVNYLKEVGNANTSGGELAFNSEIGNATYRISLSDDLGDGFATKIWRFDGTGNLTLPSGGNIISAGNLNFNNGSKIQSSVNNINLQANVNGAVELKSHGGNYTWAFDNYGWMYLPEADAAYTPVANGSVLFSPTALTFKAGMANLIFEQTGNLSAPGNVIAIANISANYFVGNGSLLTGIVAGTNYTNTNVVNLLAAFGSNTIVTTGNISGNIVAASSNTHVMFNDDGLINGSSVFTFNKNGNILTVGTTGGTISVADIATPQAGVSLRLIPASGTTRSYGHLVPQFANTYDLGQSTTRWQNMYANLANIVSLTVTGNLSTTGNLTAGNILANSALRFDSGNAKITTSSGSIVITPDTSLDALSGLIVGGSGYILSSNGTRNATLNYSSESGHVGIQGNLTVGTVGQGKLTVPGTSVTGANSIISGVTNTILPNTIAAFSANINNYSQLTIQNKNTGADATADLILTADNGSDSVNFADLGIINSGYDNSTPTNSLGNIVYAADTYLYAQGNSSATSQSGGNLVIGTTTLTKTVKIFAGGANLNSLIANISSTGIAVTGNVSVSGNVSGTTPNVNLVAGSYTYTFDNTGNVTINGTGIRMPSRPASRVYGSSSNNIVANTTLTSSNFTVDYNQGSHLNASTGVFTAPVAGMYQTTLNARVGNNNGLNQIAVLKNNGTLTGANVIAFWETDTNTGTASHFGTSGVANLVAGDTLRVKVVAGNIQFDSNDSWTVTYIG